MKVVGVKTLKPCLLTAVAVLLALPTVSSAEDRCAKQSKIFTPPSWVMTPPSDDKYLYAVGSAGPAYFIEDAKKKAAESCRTKLASMSDVSIASETMDIRKGNRQEVKTTIATVSEGLVQNVETIKYWMDVKGRTGAKPKTTYALCRIPKPEAAVGR